MGERDRRLLILLLTVRGVYIYMSYDSESYVRGSLYGFAMHIYPAA